MQPRPIVVSVADIHRMARRREETKLARYDIIVGSVSRLIRRAVLMDPKRTSMFVSLGMLMGRELTAPGVDIALGIEYVCMVLRRNAFTVEHIGEGVLLVAWPVAPVSSRLSDMHACDAIASAQPPREKEKLNERRFAVTPIIPPATSDAAFENIRRIVAKYKPTT
jgi:hypothetical protein